MLQVDDVTVTFGGVRALDQVELTAGAGSVTGLIGPNGAGKTTLFNVITGLQKPNRGVIRLGDVDITGDSPRRRSRRGLGRTFQRLEVFGSLTVRENVQVALEGLGMRGVEVKRRADELLARVGLTALAGSTADILPTGSARLLELARSLACSPKVLLLDETSSGLDEGESEHLAGLIQELAASGMAVLLVEHDMELVMRICARIYVLNFGQTIAVGTPDEVRANPDVQAAYLGTAAA